MKNLFKSLMLVAVAAMTFTACQNDNGEMDMLVKKTVITGVASLGDDTRSGFVGSETIENGDGTTTTVYKSAWDGTETIKLFSETGLETTATIDAEGKFTAEFEGELPESFFMTVCSPAESWSSQYTCTIPSVQTPSANSVDPAAHIVQKQNVNVSGGTADYFKMEHQVAYGKMTVNTPEGFVIKHVDIKLNGVWYGYAKNLSYTINADKVENNTFWFATDVIEVADFTVIAYDAEGNAYSKSVTIPEGRKLSFTYGGVSKFSVSNLEVYEEPAGPMFTSAETSSYGYDKYIYFYSEDNTLSTLKVNAYGCFSGSSWDIWNVGTYTENWVDGVGMIYTGQYTTYGNTLTESITVTVSHVEEGYKVVFENVTDTNGNIILEKAIYVGPISGLATPDPRTQLEMPDVNSSISGKTITLSWEAIENAESYLIECTSSNDIEPISTTETTATITVPSYGYYSFYVQAVVSDDSATYRSSEKAYIEYNDPREILPAPTNVTATVDGPSVTISWDAVENADGYQVYFYKDGEQWIDVDDTTITIDLGYDQSNVWIYVFSVADDTNDKYRSSESWESSVEVSTGKDPNAPFTADVMATDISWDSEGYFTLTTSEFSYFHLEVNSANRPNNNSLLPGDYTYGKNENQFRVKYNNSVVWNYSDSTGTMNVSFVDGEYIILINVTSGWGSAFKGTVGYKGMPDGWVAPDSGGNEGGETPEPELPANIALTTWNEGEYYPDNYRSSYIVSGDNISMKVWITTDHGANATSLGETHNYTWVGVSNVGNPNMFSTQNIVINGVEKDTASGTMNVVNNGDNTFNVTMKLGFTDGTSTTVTYSGAVSTTTTEPENPGEGGGVTPTPVPEPEIKVWVFTAALSGSDTEKTITMTGNDGTIVTARLTSTWGKVGHSSYYLNQRGVNNADNVTVNGEAIATENTSGTITLYLNTNKVIVDMTINGTKYVGTSTNELFW